MLHDLNLASQYCDRLFLLGDGVLRKDGTPDEVLTYQTIEEVYDTTVVVMKNPVSSRPCVFLVPEDAVAGVVKLPTEAMGKDQHASWHLLQRR